MNKVDMKLNMTAEMLKAVAHPARLSILKGLAENGECSVGYLQSRLQIPQSSVSQHLQKLKYAKVVDCERNGIEMFYKIKNKQILKLVEVLLEV